MKIKILTKMKNLKEIKIKIKKNNVKFTNII